MDDKELTIAQIDRMLEELEMKKNTLTVLATELDKLNSDLASIKYLVEFMDRLSTRNEEE